MPSGQQQKVKVECGWRAIRTNLPRLYSTSRRHHNGFDIPELLSWSPKPRIRREGNSGVGARGGVEPRYFYECQVPYVLGIKLQDQFLVCREDMNENYTNRGTRTRDKRQGYGTGIWTWKPCIFCLAKFRSLLGLILSKHGLKLQRDTSQPLHMLGKMTEMSGWWNSRASAHC
jgi:hypothetical protein